MCLKIQKSRLATFVEMGNPSWENLTQANKTSGSIKREGSTDSSESDSSTSSEELVHDTTVDPSFDLDNMEVDAFLDLSNEQHPMVRHIPSFRSGHCNNNVDGVVSLEAVEADIYKSIANDLLQDGEQALSSSTSNVTVGSKKIRSTKCSVLGAYVSCLSAKHRQSALYDVASRSSASVTTRNKFGPIDCDGIHISSCGHAVHQECHDRYLFSLKQRYACQFPVNCSIQLVHNFSRSSICLVLYQEWESCSFGCSRAQMFLIYNISMIRLAN
jgi:hypothetical protein